jgi:hypothetical protein
MAFPLSCNSFCMAADSVCCFGRFCSTAGSKPGSSDTSDADAGESGADVAPQGLPVAPLSTEAPAETFPHPDESLTGFLSRTRLASYEPALIALGATSTDDLRELDAEDFEREAGMKKSDVTRLLRSLSVGAE